MDRIGRPGAVLFGVMLVCVFLSFFFAREDQKDAGLADSGKGTHLIGADESGRLDSCSTLSFCSGVRSGQGTNVFRGNRIKMGSMRLAVLYSLFFVLSLCIFRWKSLKRIFRTFLSSDLFFSLRFLWNLTVQHRKDGKKWKFIHII